jgi:hypothetical protein
VGEAGNPRSNDQDVRLRDVVVHDCNCAETGGIAAS